MDTCISIYDQLRECPENKVAQHAGRLVRPLARHDLSQATGTVRGVAGQPGLQDECPERGGQSVPVQREDLLQLHEVAL